MTPAFLMMRTGMPSSVRSFKMLFPIIDWSFKDNSPFAGGIAGEGLS